MASLLADSASPYVRAHADNPVAWYPWGGSAFDAARRRDVPVMVSIGYSTCHWCHVMAAESFSDPATAEELNEGFVAIKVDREEHPEVDSALLAAASAFTPHLGWPLTVFTTPEGRVFYAGTYWPARRGGGLPSFREVLAAVREAWTERREEVSRTATALQEALADAAAAASAGEGLPVLAEIAVLADAVAAREDPVHGGFAAADAPAETPKFPVVPALRFLQAPALAEPRPQAAAVAARALDAMARSPLRDRVDGGFFRYATRRDWTVPHYERMLTDNAGLVEVALDAGRAEVAEGVAGFLVDTLQTEQGGFAAAQDSESWIDGARSEGGYYRRSGGDRARLDAPAIDGKVVTEWNGLAIASLAAAGTRLGRPDLVDAARRAADAVAEANVAADGLLRRASLDEITSTAPATLADYGSLASGLAALAAATGESAYAAEARRLVDLCLDAGDEAPGGRDPVLAGIGMPAAAESDGDHPSGPSALAGAALALWLLGAGERYRLAAERVVAAHVARARAEPLAHGALLRVAAGLAVPPRQLVVVADPEDPLAASARGIRADVVVVATADQARAWSDAGFSLFEGRGAIGGRATAYDCRAFVCRLPVHDPRALAG